MPFKSASVFFCFTSSTSAKHFPLRTFFIWGNKQTKKCHLRWNWVNREGGSRGHDIFGQKLLNTQRSVGRCTCSWTIHPEMGKRVERVFKQIHWSRTQPLTTTPAGTLILMSSLNSHWVGEACTTRGPPSRRLFQGFLGPPSYFCALTISTAVLNCCEDKCYSIDGVFLLLVYIFKINF